MFETRVYSLMNMTYNLVSSVSKQALQRNFSLKIGWHVWHLYLSRYSVLLNIKNNRIIMFLNSNLFLCCKSKHTQNYGHQQYKLLRITFDNIEVYEEPVARIKRIPHCAVKFEASEENRIVNESLYCINDKSSKLREWKEKNIVI